MAEDRISPDGGPAIPSIPGGGTGGSEPAAAAGGATAGTPDPLKMPAGRDIVFFLERNGILHPAARAAALEMLRPPGAWLLFIRRILLVVGAALLLAGVVFFFAYNWERMGDFLKFGLIEAGILACAFGAWRLSLDRLPGKILATAASVLVGVFLAVYGQVYQTGADAYELFAGWAALMLPLAVTARFAPLWFIWLVLLNLAAVLCAEQRYGLLDRQETAEWVFLVAAATNVAALIAHEALGRRGFAEFADKWLRRTILAASLLALMIPVGMLIVNPENVAAECSSLALYVCFSVGAWVYFRYKSRDFACLALAVLSACILASIAAARGIGELTDGLSHAGINVGIGFSALLGGVTLLGIFGGGALWLRRTARGMAEEAAEKRRQEREAAGPDGAADSGAAYSSRADAGWEGPAAAGCGVADRPAPAAADSSAGRPLEPVAGAAYEAAKTLGGNRSPETGIAVHATGATGGISGIGAEKPDGRQEVAPGMGTDAEASAPAAGRSQTVGELLEKLRDAGLAPPDLAKRAAEVLKGFRPEAATVEAETRGRMVAGLAAAGAWAASMCFIAFVSALLGRDFANIAMLGIGWMIGAILLQRFAGPQSVFFRQVSLACMIAGHLMILAAAPDVLCEIGEGRRIEEVYTAAVVAALLAAIFYPLYGCAFYRFFSIACTITLLAVAAVYESRLEDVNWERIWIWHIMVVASAVCAGAVFLIPRISRRALLPAAYSCAAAMPTLLGIMTVVPFLDKKVSAPLWPSAILLGVLLVAFSCAAARRFPTGGEAGRWRGAAFSHPLKAATAALIVAAGLAVLQLPGATAAVGLLLLGFYAGDCIVMAIGFASLPFFVGCYYYSLSLDLMEKSLLLIANGILMILLYFTAGRLQGRPAWREA